MYSISNDIDLNYGCVSQ